MKRRVVITGIGPVTALGIGREAFFANVLAAKTAGVSIPPAFEKHGPFQSRFYVPFPPFTLADYVDTSFAAIMEKTAKAAVVGAKLALHDAHLTPPPETAVMVGVGIGALTTAFQSHMAHSQEGLGFRFNRMVIPMQMPNAASAWVSILFGLHGPQFTLNASCASGTCAIGEAYRKIADGYCSTVVAGGVECLEDATGSIMRGFDALHALTKAPDGLPRPFSRGRSGFLFSEGGGCLLVLEEQEQARARQAPVYAEIAGYEANSDGHSIVQMEETGAHITALVRNLVQSEKIDYLNAHGTGTVQNDDIEARVIRTVFGNRETQPFINSTKGLLGHTIGASGAIEAAVTALAISAGRVHGNLLDEPMADLNLPTATIDVPVRAALSLSFGFGGHNAGLLLKRCEDAGQKPGRKP